MFLLSFVLGLAHAESYFRADMGMTGWRLNHPQPFTAPVHSAEFTYGRKMGVFAIEFAYRTDVWNGASYDQQPGNISVNNYFQGDSRMNSLTVGIRQGFTIGQKLEAGYRVNGGVATIPVLMDSTSFDTLVVGQSWGLTAPPNHTKTYIPVSAGGYVDFYRFYENLAVGLNADVVYVTGWDLGTRISISMNSRF